ncbi:unnamed protein product [Paramecium pentaurelia]|uniref:Uncharacterized protein n=1 Tax=Paramecium pentaurelia TaxID=43138 RepID=A0A8S1UWQ5_9CILI|nr:unnamed protein product [Paramecium pentaurelia]
MGATCKFREREKDIISQESLSSLPNLNSEPDAQTNLKYKVYGKSKNSRNVANTPENMERPHFFIIYPRNQNQRNDLILQLQDLNRNNNYYIEEYSQMTSQSIESKYESNFSLNEVSEGSFNVFRI